MATGSLFRFWSKSTGVFRGDLLFPWC